MAHNNLVMRDAFRVIVFTYFANHHSRHLISMSADGDMHRDLSHTMLFCGPHLEDKMLLKKNNFLNYSRFYGSIHHFHKYNGKW